MLQRFLLAVLSLHCTICALALLVAGSNALPFFVGFAYLWFIQGLAHVPVLIAPALAALVCFVIVLVYTANRPRVFLLLAGLVPIVVFLGLSEIVVFGAMHISFLGLEQVECMFDRQSFTASLFDIARNIDFLFGDIFRFQNHAQVVLSNENLMIWSYSELSFVNYDPDYNVQQIVPQRCVDS